MKLGILLAIALVFSLVLPMHAADAPKVKKKKQGPVCHMVAFKFKETATKEQIEKIQTEFKALKKKIPQIVSFQSGLNHSPENLNKGLTHGYLLTFQTTADRDTYLNHPAHKAFGALVMPALADVFVLDFTAAKK